MSDLKGPRSRKLLWLAVLLLAVAAGVAAAVPLLPCPSCLGSGGLWDPLRNSKRELKEGQYGDCPDCDGGKVTLLKRALR